MPKIDLMQQFGKYYSVAGMIELIRELNTDHGRD